MGFNKSKFQFSNPTITNINLTKQENPNLKKDFHYNIENSVKIKKSQTENKATVYLSLKIGEINNDCPFCLIITDLAHFKCDENVSNEQFDKLLSTNAPALLLSYLRPVISLILSQAGLPNFNIPFVDFTGDFSEYKEINN